MAAADLNRDGLIDVAAGAGDSMLLLLRGSKGGFARSGRAELTGAWTVAVGDLDGDGQADVAGPDADADVVWLWLSSP